MDLWKTIRSFLKKLKVELPYKLQTNSTSGYFSEEKKTILKRYMHPYVHCNITYNDQDMEASKVSIARRVNKEITQIQYDVVYMWDIKKNRTNE